MAQTLTETQWRPPVPVRAGPEMEALRLFHFDCRWAGTVEAGGMGPGSPEMNGVGQGTYQPMMDGAWLVGSFEQDQFVDGALVITWKAHFVVGWDPRAGEYRATYVDNNGSAALLRGWIEGARCIFETLGEAAVRVRLTWELLEPGRVKWRNDCSIGGGPWLLIEEYICTPL